VQTREADDGTKSPVIFECLELLMTSGAESLSLAINWIIAWMN
jgi:hypothetical protein